MPYPACGSRPNVYRAAMQPSPPFFLVLRLKIANGWPRQAYERRHSSRRYTHISAEPQPRGLSMVGPRVSPRSYELLQPVALSMLAAAPMSYESQPRGLSMVGPRVSPRHTPMHTQSALGEPPEAPGAPTASTFVKIPGRSALLLRSRAVLQFVLNPGLFCTFC